jgi:threonine dehydratase
MDLASLRAAYRRIAPHAYRTPLLTSRLLDELLGKRLLLKAEHLQKTGSFKARGALAKALTLESPKGLLAVSSGNHAQGVAYAAQVLGVKALIVVPEEASPLKKAAARAYGAEVVDRGVTAENREEVAKALKEETGYAFIHHFDDPWVIAGQGTAGLELMVQAGKGGLPRGRSGARRRRRAHRRRGHGGQGPLPHHLGLGGEARGRRRRY